MFLGTRDSTFTYYQFSWNPSLQTFTWYNWSFILPHFYFPRINTKNVLWPLVSSLRPSRWGPSRWTTWLKNMLHFFPHNVHEYCIMYFYTSCRVMRLNPQLVFVKDLVLHPLQTRQWASRMQGMSASKYFNPEYFGVYLSWRNHQMCFKMVYSYP